MYPDVSDLERRNMSAMISALDAGIGATVQDLNSTGLWANTLLTVIALLVPLLLPVPPQSILHATITSIVFYRSILIMEESSPLRPAASPVFRMKMVAQETTFPSVVENSVYVRPLPYSNFHCDGFILTVELRRSLTNLLTFH